MRVVVPILSTLLQAVYVLGLFGFIVGLIKIIQVSTLYETGDPKMIAGAISILLMSFGFDVVIGLIGVFLAWVTLKKLRYRPKWFVSLSKFFAISWFVFVPLGTLIGFFMLKWRNADKTASAAT